MKSCHLYSNFTFGFYKLTTWTLQNGPLCKSLNYIFSQQKGTFCRQLKEGKKNDLVLSKDYGMQKISKGHLFIWWLLFNLAVTSILYRGYEKTLNILFIEGRSWNFFTPPPIIATTQTRLWADLVTEHSLIFVSE